MELTTTNYIGKTIANLETVEVGELVKGILSYESTGNTPSFTNPKVEGAFNRIVNSLKPEKTLTNVCCGEEDRKELTQLLSAKSYLFNETERNIIKAMLEISWGRNEKYLGTPFMLTARKIQEHGFDYADFTNLRKFLKGENVLDWEKRQSGTFQYQVTYYGFDEPKLLELVRTNVEN